MREEEAPDHMDKTGSGRDVGSFDDERRVDDYDGTILDVKDMKRMGKQQLFRRNFRFISIFSFTVILLSTWESVLGTAAFGLGNGGTAGVLYIYLVAYTGLLVVYTCLAEMASMAPTAGGQYHWISELAPPSTQQFLSYVMGWLCVLAWQTGVAAGAFLTATEIQGLIVLNYGDAYDYQRWHGTLLTIAIILLATLVNTIGIRVLPYLEMFGLVLHVGGFLGYIIPLWINAPPADDHAVWTTFSDTGNWGNTGVAALVGIISPLTAITGADAAVHMSEELRNAAKSLPRAMMASMAFNGALGFVTVVTFVYNIGSNPGAVLNTKTGYPFIQLFYNATGSRAGTTAITSIILSLSFLNTVANLAAASRQLFAFARDHGVPFRQFFAAVPQHGAVHHVPLNAVLTTILITTLLSLINIGSTDAYNQILSLGIAALLSSYLVSTACMALRHLRRQPPRRGPFSLGVCSLPMNLLAVAFLSLAFVFSLFPPSTAPTPANMNWAPLIWGVVALFALSYFALVGRHHYAGPVMYVKRDE